MQEMYFEREGMNRYMVISQVEEVEQDSYANSLLTVVEIPQFMNYEVRETDGVQSIYYKLKYQTVLRQVLGDLSLTRSRLEYMLRSIVHVLRQTEEYLLCQENILWNSSNIFIEVNTGKLVFTYYPGEKQNENALQNFLMELIQYVDKGQQQAYLYVMEFYNAVTNPDCTLDKLEQYVGCKMDEAEYFIEEEHVVNKMDKERSSNDSEASDKENYGKCSISKKIARNKTESITTQEPEVHRKKSLICVVILLFVNLAVACCLLFEIWTYQYIWVLVVTLILLVIAFLSQEKTDEKDIDQIMREYQQEQLLEGSQKPYNNGVVISEDMQFDNLQELLAGDMETSLLAQGKEQIVVEDYPKEIYLKTKLPKQYSDLCMKKNSMVLGSMRDGCDYQMPERGISRMHAKVLKKEDGLYLLDMNSTNGTYVNGQAIQSGKEYLLEEGDEIALAKTVAFVVAKKEIIDK